MRTAKAKAKTKPVPKRPIDPRIQRVMDLIESAHDRLERDGHDHTFDRIVEGVLAGLHGDVCDLDGAKRTILSLAAKANDSDIDESVAIAEELHRETCVCCRKARSAA